MLLLTLRGTPTMYYGDEIGMRDVDLAADQVQDPWENNVPGLGLGRDPERTPMQWDASPNAGFTTGRPWLPLAPDAHAVNVASQRDDPRSMLNLSRRLLALRRAHPALSVGIYEPVPADGEVLAYARDAAPDRCLVALNLGPSPQRLVVPTAFRGSRVLISTALDREGDEVGTHLELRGDEGIIAGSSSHDAGLSDEPSRRST
jgi:alpha-glucosidase